MSLLALSPKASLLKEKLEKFVNERCIPSEKEYEEHINQFSGKDRWTSGKSSFQLNSCV